MKSIGKSGHHVALGLLFGLMASIAVAADVKVSDPVVRAVPKVSTNSAAFLTLTNEGKKDVKLVSVDSDIAERVELHGHKKEGDMMRMFKVDDIDVPAGKTVKLQSGGYHIMVMGLKKPVTAGGEVDLTLHFSDGDAVDVKAPVKDLSNVKKDTAHGSSMEGDSMEEDSMDHSTMKH
jgi:copper(I)-binding protein